MDMQPKAPLDQWAVVGTLPEGAKIHVLREVTDPSTGAVGEICIYEYKGKVHGRTLTDDLKLRKKLKKLLKALMKG